MKQNTKKILIIIGVILAIIVGGFLVWKNFFEIKQDTTEQENVYEVYELYERDPISSKGVVALDVNDSYSYREELGEIETVHVEEGQAVEKGQALFTYRKSSGPEQQAVNEADRQLKALIAQRDRLANTPVDPELGDTGLDGEIADLNAQIEMAQASLNDAAEALTTTITAANAGTVYLNNSGRTDDSVPFVRVIGQEVYIRGSVNEFDFFALALDRKVSIYVEAIDETIDGTISEYDKFPPAQEASLNTSAAGMDAMGAMGGSFGAETPEISSSSSFNFVVRPQKYIQPGFSVDLMIEVPGIALPEETIVEEGDQTYVFVYSKGKVKKQAVTFEKQGLDRVITDDSFKPGMKLVLHPDDLEDGEKIDVTEPDTTDDSEDK